MHWMKESTMAVKSIRIPKGHCPICGKPVSTKDCFWQTPDIYVHNVCLPRVVSITYVNHKQTRLEVRG
jgi:hypothetical protein